MRHAIGNPGSVLLGMTPSRVDPLMNQFRIPGSSKIDDGLIVYAHLLGSGLPTFESKPFNNRTSSRFLAPTIEKPVEKCVSLLLVPCGPNGPPWSPLGTVGVPMGGPMAPLGPLGPYGPY